MPGRPWKHTLRRGLRGRRRSPVGGGGFALPPILVTLVVALLVAACTIRGLETRLRPVILEAARAQTKNTMTAVLEQAVRKDLAERAVSYADLIRIHRDSSGAISSLTTDMAALNLLRTELVDQVLVTLQGVDVSVVEIPLGTLVDSELVWARGPAIQAHAMWVGTVSAEFESQFSAAGVNQTLHRIWLEVSVPLTVLLPGGRVEVPVDTRLCITETVIVGKVPNTYLNWDQLSATG